MEQHGYLDPVDDDGYEQFLRERPQPARQIDEDNRRLCKTEVAIAMAIVAIAAFVAAVLTVQAFEDFAFLKRNRREEPAQEG